MNDSFITSHCVAPSGLHCFWRPFTHGLRRGLTCFKKIQQLHTSNTGVGGTDPNGSCSSRYLIRWFGCGVVFRVFTHAVFGFFLQLLGHFNELFLESLFDVVVEYLYTHPLERLTVGPLGKKLIEASYLTVNKAVHAAVFNLVPHLADEQLVAAAGYYEGLIVQAPAQQKCA